MMKQKNAKERKYPACEYHKGEGIGQMHHFSSMQELNPHKTNAGQAFHDIHSNFD